MNHSLRVAFVALLGGCGGAVDVVGVVGLVGSDAGSAAIPVVTQSDGDKDASFANMPVPQRASGVDAGPDVLQPSASGSSGSATDAGSTTVDRPAVPLPPAADGCGDDGSASCSRQSAAAFVHALCACGDVTGPSTLDVLGAQGERCAPVGVNGNFAVEILPRVGGDGMPTEPTRDPHASNPPAAVPPTVGAMIGGDLDVGGVLSVSGNVHVLGDVWSQTLPVGSGMLQVDGDLHTSQPVVVPTTNLRVSGMQRPDAHGRSAPCTCEPSARLDAAGLVNAAAQHNNNAEHGVAADSLNDMIGAKSLDWSCGRYYVHGVNILGDLALRVHGHVMLFVQGDFVVQGEIQVDLAQDAELDIVVSSNVTLVGSARFAPAERAGSARVYLGGQLSLGLAFGLPAANARGSGMQVPVPPSAAPPQSPITVIGNVYAPSAVLQLSTPTDVTGSLFVGGLVLLQPLTLHSALAPSGGACGF